MSLISDTGKQLACLNPNLKNTPTTPPKPTE